MVTLLMSEELSATQMFGIILHSRWTRRLQKSDIPTIGKTVIPVSLFKIWSESCVSCIDNKVYLRSLSLNLDSKVLLLLTGSPSPVLAA